jgi:hypothetical protein
VKLRIFFYALELPFHDTTYFMSQRHTTPHPQELRCVFRAYILCYY